MLMWRRFNGEVLLPLLSLSLSLTLSLSLSLSLSCQHLLSISLILLHILDAVLCSVISPLSLTPGKTFYIHIYYYYLFFYHAYAYPILCPLVGVETSDLISKRHLLGSPPQKTVSTAEGNDITADTQHTQILTAQLCSGRAVLLYDSRLSVTHNPPLYSNGDFEHCPRRLHPPTYHYQYFKSDISDVVQM